MDYMDILKSDDFFISIIILYSIYFKINDNIYSNNNNLLS